MDYINRTVSYGIDRDERKNMCTRRVLVLGLLGTTVANLELRVKELEQTVVLAPRVDDMITDRIDGLHQRLDGEYEQHKKLNKKIGSLDANWILFSDLVHHDLKELFQRWDEHFVDDDGDMGDLILIDSQTMREHVARKSKVSTE